MWTIEHKGEAATGPEPIFDLMKDVAAWPEWNAGVARVDMDGPFSSGTNATMVLPRGDVIAFRLVWVDHNRGFEDETDVPEEGVTVRVRHLLEPLGPQRTAITYQCIIDGPAADDVGPTLGPAITSDFPDVIKALAARAEASLAP
jgi:hypothetical protein